MPIDVSDAASNANEQIDHAAKTIGRSKLRRTVFKAIYHGKKRVKTVTEIARSSGLSRKQVLNEGRKLANAKIAKQTKQDGDTAYEKIDFYHLNKLKILRLAGNKAKLDAFPTKRNTVQRLKTITLQLDTRRANAAQVTIDDLDSFSKVRSITASDLIPKEVSESAFKSGIQQILGEPGTFRDWGGEKNDLFSTRLRFRNHRRPVEFAFKGPGTRGKLVPGKMGKNGDQIQRLFETDADIFLVQYWRDIDQSVLIQMGQLALAKSVMTCRKIWYGIIDGYDSNRIYIAYRSKFSNPRSQRRKQQTRSRES
jgi:DNA-binding transcriptional regulator GbsR (MarR family)